MFRINKICTKNSRLSGYRKQCLRISATLLPKSYPLKSVLQGVEAPVEAVITLTPTKFTFELEGEPADAANLKL